MSKTMGGRKGTYIIAEVGQNHNGDIELAKKLIDMIAMPIYDEFSGRTLPGVDGVKFTKRDLGEELADDEAARPYDSPHSFGATYGEHREKLELGYTAFEELERYARDKGLEFIVTLCSPATLKLTDRITIDRIKVASRDLTNTPLLERIAETGRPVILSTGMSDLSEIHRAVNLITRRHDRLSILHCISQYPAQYENINLRAIRTLQEEFGDRFPIGYSDHSIGIMVPVLAVGLGASIIEKHVTLNRSMKGSDHAGSLEMDGLWRMTRDIRNAELALGNTNVECHEAATGALKKLRRSLAIKRGLETGQPLLEDMLVMLSPGSGLRWEDRKELVGRRARQQIPERTLLYPEMFE